MRGMIAQQHAPVEAITQTVSDEQFSVWSVKLSEASSFQVHTLISMTLQTKGHQHVLSHKRKARIIDSQELIVVRTAETLSVNAPDPEASKPGKQVLVPISLHQANMDLHQAVQLTLLRRILREPSEKLITE